MRTNNYRQCKLRRNIPGGTQETTSYIPEKFAIVGDVLKLRNIQGKWTDGWIVESAGPLEAASLVEANARNHLKQRKASDVIFSKIKEENQR